ncbi:MAG: LCP family protein, partial [Acidimicrobiia bacterium]
MAWFMSGSMTRDGEVVSFLEDRIANQPLNVLVVGNDTRDDLPTDDPYWFGLFTGQRADVVILVAFDPDVGEIRLLSLDRDLRVETGEYGPLTIAETFGYGGSSLLVRSVNQLTDTPVHHYLELSFDGFVYLVDALNGLTVPFCEPSRDRVTGLRVSSGSVELDGEGTLALVRSRAFERLVDGEWVPADQGNAGRVE